MIESIRPTKNLPRNPVTRHIEVNTVDDLDIVYGWLKYYEMRADKCHDAGDYEGASTYLLFILALDEVIGTP